MATTDLTAENFENTVKDNEIVLVDFWADWCGPCKSFAPVFEQASEQHSDIAFGKVDTEDQQQMAAAFGISSIPTLMVFREGVGVFRQAGALPAPQLEELITGVRGLDMEDVHAKVAEQQKKMAEEQAAKESQQGTGGAPGTSPTDF